MNRKTLINKFIMYNVLIALFLLAMAIVQSFGPADVLKMEKLFDLNREQSIPTWFSVILLFGLATICFGITIGEIMLNRAYVTLWRHLALFLLIMSVEEVVGVRENFVTPFLRSIYDFDGIFYYPWVLPVTILLIIFIYAYSNFIMNLPTRVRNTFILGFVMYVGGAVGFELVGGFVKTSFANEELREVFVKTFIIFEEMLEIVGLITILYALLTYLSDAIVDQLSSEQLQHIPIEKFQTGLIRDGAVVAVVFLLVVLGAILVSVSTTKENQHPAIVSPQTTPIIQMIDLPRWQQIIINDAE